MERIPTVSIGIPAYNESANLKKLLISLLEQVEIGYQLLEIIVISDGSTDETVNQVLSISSEKIKLIDDKSRLGKSARLNQIFKAFNGDILLLLDADIAIQDKQLISKVVDAGVIEQIGLMGINAIPHKSVNLFQKSMQAGVMVTREIGKRWKKGNNYLSFKGCFLALSKSFGKSINMPKEIINNDSYLYFAAINQGLSPIFLENAIVYYKSPQIFSDYLMQSERFKVSKSEMQKYFNFDLKPYYDIPGSVFLVSFVKSFFSNPVFFIGYISLNIFAKFKKQHEIKSAWNIATSTKK